MCSRSDRSRSIRRRDGGGNRRGSRRALGRRLPESRHRLWGLSDAAHRWRIGGREHGRSEGSTTRRRPQPRQRDGSSVPPPSTPKKTPHDCAPRHSLPADRRYGPPTNALDARIRVGSCQASVQKRNGSVTPTAARRLELASRPRAGPPAATGSGAAPGAPVAARCRA